MNPHVNAITGRLSLRSPQRDSLEILAHVCDLITLDKQADSAEALDKIKREFSTVTDFERDFPSLCFALATGVGKTRLMGAFIAYLYEAKRIRHFFVLAPNLTIYNKLFIDFTPNTPKYVLQGISAFATDPPEIITGDNYETGRGVRPGYLFDTGPVHINIFNISKINSEVRGGKSPRIKRLSEYIGESYFEYLSKLDDLVLLMDESHRYRASAGVRAINELKPILGLELTATPQIEKGSRTQPFKNVIYSYPLSRALADGFVKEPAVATRENFEARNYTEEGLERLKLEDGIRIHEYTRTELDVFSRQHDRPLVKPFMLVVAQDTGHADKLVKIIEDESFFEGRYKGRVITVHSGQKGEERDETVQQLLSVEDLGNPTEIVIHVNMLKEGWDVTNLYTIVPLRAANSKTLVEQSIGRGLRLPYGTRVDVPAVDRLTIVSHDRFQEIVDDANRPDSIIRTGVVIGRDIPDKPARVVQVESVIVSRIGGIPGVNLEASEVLFSQPEERNVASAALQVIQQFEHLPRSADLLSPEIQREIIDKVSAKVEPVQYRIEGIDNAVDVRKIVVETMEEYIKLSIDIPKVIVVPQGEVTCGFANFALDLSGLHLQPVAQDILVQHLRDHARYHLDSGSGIVSENRPEDYLVRGLTDFDDVHYDNHAELLYNLTGQVVSHLKSYLNKEEDVLNVLQYHQQTLVNLIHAQMQDHYEEDATGYKPVVSKGFTILRSRSYSAPAHETPRNFRQPVDEKALVRGMLFKGFKKCLYSIQKFDSDTERRFSVILENEENVLKWIKLGREDFQIDYRIDDVYVPDFVVETKINKYLCETKRANQMKEEDVLAKAKAAVAWCEHATAHEKAHGGKSWSYLLIPDDAIAENKTLQGLAVAFSLTT